MDAKVLFCDKWGAAMFKIMFFVKDTFIIVNSDIKKGIFNNYESKFWHLVEEIFW